MIKREKLLFDKNTNDYCQDKFANKTIVYRYFVSVAIKEGI